MSADLCRDDKMSSRPERTVVFCQECDGTGYELEGSDDPEDGSFGLECPACNGNGFRR